jgi:signal transduction histidine kinase/CheY-like chemotaxis protein
MGWRGLCSHKVIAQPFRNLLFGDTGLKEMPKMKYSGKILVVDDDPSICALLRKALTHYGCEYLEARSGDELFQVLANHPVDLTLLDIRLPGPDGLTLLPKIKEKFPEVYVVMLTGVIDTQTALSAIRQGAFDYIAKPFSIDELQVVVSRALEKKALERENLQYVKNIKEKGLRLEILHTLSTKIGNSLLSTVELEEIFRIIMVGITAGEGLGLNRAFLALYNESGSLLAGKIAIGPGNPEEAGRIWSSLEEKKGSLGEAIAEYGRTCTLENIRVNQVVKEILIPTADRENILIRASKERRSFNVHGGCVEARPIKEDIPALLGSGDFAVVPLCSPDRVQGVLIADNFITGKDITEEDVATMELFANQAALAIEKSMLYAELASRIKSLESAHEELQASRGLLVRVERLSALGEMAAQIAHEMKNPLASIGGLARFVHRRSGEEKLKGHLEVIIRETSRLEQILAHLFDFIRTPAAVLTRVEPHKIISSCLNALEAQIRKQKVELVRHFSSELPAVQADENQMKEVVLNLLRNAVEAMACGGSLRVATRWESDEIIIDIEDTGPGLSAEDLELARRPFFTTKTQGLGLGLNLAEKILQAHQGRLDLTGEFGAGVRASIALPASRLSS